MKPFERELIYFKPDFWLSGLIGKAVWVEKRNQGMTAQEITQPHLASLKVQTNQLDTLREAEGYGFKVVDVNVTFLALPKQILDKSRAWGKENVTVRYSKPEDREDVKAIALEAFKYSRFHLDPQIPNEVADTIKAEWAENYFKLIRGDGMVVAEVSGNVVGFCQLLEALEGTTIDLIAVSEKLRWSGAGKAMIKFTAENGTKGKPPPLIWVGTQAANIPSLRLYETMGFRVTQTKYVLHRHG